MVEINIKNTPFDSNWSYKINLIGVAHLFSDKLEHHYIIFSHGKYYDVYSDSDGIIEIKDILNFPAQNGLISTFYLCKNKELTLVDYDNFIKTKFGNRIDQDYFDTFGKRMSSNDFIFFNNAFFSKTYQKIEDIIVDFTFGFNIDDECFDLCKVDYETFIKRIGGV